jgi:Domain of unknown function (DUF4139)
VHPPGFRRKNVLCDGGAVYVDIVGVDVDAHFTHETVPRASLDVFRSVLVQVPTRGVSLRAGAAVDVFLDGDWIVQTAMDRRGGAQLKLNLGVDARVRVTARTINVQQGEKGLLGGQVKIAQHVVVRLSSQAPTPVDVRVFERLPVDGNQPSEVTVTLDEAEPKPERDVGPHGTLRGGLSFMQRLLPHEERVVDYRFTLVHSNKIDIVGGARRDSNQSEQT